MKVRVLRAFFLNGKVQDVGTVVEIADRPLLGGLRSNGKVEDIEPEPPVAGPMTTETAGLVSGKRPRAKESSND